MSGLGCILHADTRSPDPGDLRRVLAGSSARAVDGVESWTDAGVALGFLSFATTPDAVAASQLIVEPQRRLAVVFDGRLDNRDELCSRLGMASGDERFPDARIVLEACARWDVDAPARLLGDFAFIVWDGSRRRLVAARDHMGVRPLHFCKRPRLLICATDVAQILAHPSVPREPDLDVVADYLSQDIRNGPATLYRNVRRVPPGHVLVAERGSVRLVRYWLPEPRAPIRYDRDDEYAAHCRELLDRSVTARLRSDRPVAALLSGGLDSSSVVAAARRVLTARGGGPPCAYSMVFPDRPEADERRFILAAAEHFGIEPVTVVPRSVTAERLQAHARQWLDFPAFASDFGARALYETICQHGHRTILTGCGGDYLFAGSVFQYADLLRRFRLVAALRQFLADKGTDASGWSRLGLVRAGIWPLLPLPVKRRLRPLARRITGFDRQPDWLRLQRVTPDPLPQAPRGGRFATEDVTRELESGLHSLFMEAGERALADVPLEARHPFLDVRLVDFALSIPEEQRRRGRDLKFVLRGALGDELPSRVAARRTKGDFGYVIVEALEALGGAAMFSRLQIAEAGWVDGALARHSYDRMRRLFERGDQAYGDFVPSLWLIAAVELWFGAVFGAKPQEVTAGAARGII